MKTAPNAFKWTAHCDDVAEETKTPSSGETTVISSASPESQSGEGIGINLDKTSDIIGLHGDIAPGASGEMDRDKDMVGENEAGGKVSTQECDVALPRQSFHVPGDTPTDVTPTYCGGSDQQACMEEEKASSHHDQDNSISHNEQFVFHSQSDTSDEKERGYLTSGNEISTREKIGSVGGEMPCADTDLTDSSRFQHHPLCFEVKDSELNETHVEEVAIGQIEKACGQQVEASAEEKSEVYRIEDKDLECVDKESCLNIQCDYPVENNRISDNSQTSRILPTGENKLDNDVDTSNIDSSLDEKDCLDSGKKSSSLREITNDGQPYPNQQVHVSGVETGISKAITTTACDDESKDLVQQESRDSKDGIPGALVEKRHSIEKNDVSFDKEKELSQKDGNNVTSMCVVGKKCDVNSVYDDTIHQVAAVNSHWSFNSDDSMTTSGGLNNCRLEETQQQSCFGMDGDMDRSLQVDFTMSNNSRAADGQTRSPTEQERVDPVTNVVASAPVPIESSAPVIDQVASSQSPDDDGDDINFENNDDEDDDAHQDDLMDKPVRSPVDTGNKQPSNDIFESGYNEETDILDDASPKKSFAKLNESELRVLKSAIGEVLKGQSDQKSVDSYTSLSNSMSHYSSDSGNSAMSLHTSGSMEINTAEFDFASVFPNCNGFVISASDRTEADAQTLLAHIINGDPDPCLKADDGFGLPLTAETEDRIDGKSGSLTAMGTEERDITFHNTALTGNYTNMPIFGQSTIHNATKESSDAHVNVTCIDEQTQEIGSNMNYVNHDLRCSQTGRDCSLFACDDDEDVSKKEAGDNVNCVENSKSGSLAVRPGVKSENTSPRENKLPKDLERADTETGNVDEETLDYGCEKEQHLCSVDVRSKPNLSRVSEEDLRRYENSNIIYSVTSAQKKVLLDGNSKPDERIDKDESSTPSDHGKRMNFLPHGPKNVHNDSIGEPESLSDPNDFKSAVKTTLDIEGISPENTDVVAGSICPCNSEECATDASKNGFKAIGLPREGQKALLVSKTEFIDISKEAKSMSRARSKDQEHPNRTSVIRGNKDTLLHKSASVTKRGAPFVARNPMDNIKLLPEIAKKQLPRNRPERFPKRPSITNNLKAKRINGPTDNVPHSLISTLPKGARPRFMAPTVSNSTDINHLKKSKAASKVSPDRVRGQTVDQNTLLPLSPPRTRTINKTQRMPGLQQRDTVVNLSEINTSRTTESKYKDNATAQPVTNRSKMIRPVTAAPQNVNANKMKCSKLQTERLAADPFNLTVYKSSSSSSSSNKSHSSTTNSSVYPDMEGACHQYTNRKYDEGPMSVVRAKNAAAIEAVSQINSLHDGPKSPFPDVFQRSQQRPPAERAKLYAPKKHLKPGITPAEEYHKYKMDLRLHQSLNKIKRGPPTVDCYLDPRLKPRKARLQQLTQYGPQEPTKYNTPPWPAR